MRKFIVAVFVMGLLFMGPSATAGEYGEAPSTVPVTKPTVTNTQESLPNTGGPDAYMVGYGALVLSLGAGTVIVSRKRSKS